ncbi:hypothetical protein RND81_03G199200 [Saponaria officinalis]|uniref:(S)-ureidoglycine aminohydrolase cupin domain-containing protein n=1 Tax=Saponaria officinalis TaxID=3572 RepID=A0AAW1MAY4_SAPOF
MQIPKPSLLQSLLILLVSLLISSYFFKISPNSKQITPTMKESSTFTEIHGVKIEKNPPQSKLDQLGVTSWSKWSGQPGKIPWTFEAEETMYLLEGKVQVSVDGHEESFIIEAGDLAMFPKGMKITFDVLEAVNKHYSLKK